MRLDKYLKVSRLIKRRTVAADACNAARVNLNGKEAKPSKEVQIGDVIEVFFGTTTLKIRVTSTTECVKKQDSGAMYEVI